MQSNTVRINEDSKKIIERIHIKTDTPKGKILYDSLRMLEEELINQNYNYSKIIEKYPRK